MSNRPGRPPGGDPKVDLGTPSGSKSAASRQYPSSSASAGPSAGLQQDPSISTSLDVARAGLRQDHSSSIPSRIAPASSQGPSLKRGAPSSIESQLNKLAKRFGPINVDGLSVAAMRASVEKELERVKGKSLTPSSNLPQTILSKSSSSEGVKDEVPPTSNNGADSSQSKDPAKRISYLEGFAKRRQKECRELKEFCKQQYSKIEDKNQQLVEKNQELDEKDHELDEKDHELDEKDHELDEKDQEIEKKNRMIELLNRKIGEKDHEIRNLGLSLDTMATFVPETRLLKCEAAIAVLTTGVVLDPFSTSGYPDDDNDSENPPWTDDGVGGICIEPEEQEPRLDIATHTSTVVAPIQKADLSARRQEKMPEQFIAAPGHSSVPTGQKEVDIVPSFSFGSGIWKDLEDRLSAGTAMTKKPGQDAISAPPQEKAIEGESSQPKLQESGIKGGNQQGTNWQGSRPVS